MTSLRRANVCTSLPLQHIHTAHFHGSKHISQPKAVDFAPHQLNTSRNTFPSPPPSTFYPFKPNSSNPASAISDPSSSSTSNVFDDTRAADFGRFSLPIRGLKRNTRRIVRSGGAGEEIASTVDWHLRTWLDRPEVFLRPDAIPPASFSRSKLNSRGTDDDDDLDDRCLLCLETDSGPQAAITQITRQPHSLVWQIDDGFVRFLVHAVARYYRVVSFSECLAGVRWKGCVCGQIHAQAVVISQSTLPARSMILGKPLRTAKTDPSTSCRFVHLLRPNMATKTLDPFVQLNLETPPTTEWEASSATSGHGSSTDVGLTTEDEGLSASGDLDGEELEDGSSDWDVVDRESEEEAGDTTLLAGGDDGESSQSSLPPPPPTRRPRTLHYHPHILSDIDSGAEVDGEEETDEEERNKISDVESLSGSVAALCVRDHPGRHAANDHPPFPATPRHRHREEGESEAREARTSLSRRAVLVPQMNRPNKSTPVSGGRRSRGAGWLMPEQTFIEWVMAG